MITVSAYGRRLTMTGSDAPAQMEQREVRETTREITAARSDEEQRAAADERRARMQERLAQA